MNSGVELGPSDWLLVLNGLCLAIFFLPDQHIELARTSKSARLQSAIWANYSVTPQSCFMFLLSKIMISNDWTHLCNKGNGQNNWYEIVFVRLTRYFSCLTSLWIEYIWAGARTFHHEFPPRKFTLHPLHILYIHFYLWSLDSNGILCSSVSTSVVKLIRIVRPWTNNSKTFKFKLIYWFTVLSFGGGSQTTWQSFFNYSICLKRYTWVTCVCSMSCPPSSPATAQHVVCEWQLPWIETHDED